MMKVLIVDDEPLARERLRNLLAKEGNVEVVGEAANGQEAIERTAVARPDIVLLDVRMPGMDGLEAARHIAALPDPPAVIFTTAFGEHALEAFEAAASDYLLKPVRKDRLQQALASAQRITRAQSLRLQQESRPHREHIAVRVRDRLRLVPVEAIRCFRADSKYTVLCTPEGEYLIEEPLKSLEEEFRGTFRRVHRNALVNPRHATELQRLENGRYRLLLQGLAEPVEVSRAHAGEVRAWFSAGGRRYRRAQGES